MDSASNVYVADMGVGRVQKFDAAGSFLLQFGSPGEGDGQFASKSFGNRMAIGPAGTIFVGDSKGRVQEFEPNGAFKTKVTLAGEPDIGSLAMDSVGNFYILDFGDTENGVRKFSPAGVELGAFATLSDLPLGVVLSGESPVALDEAGNINVVAVKSGSYEVLEYDPLGGHLIAPGAGFPGFEPGVVIQALATNTVTAAGGVDLYLAATTGTSTSFASAYGPPPDKWPPPPAPPSISAQYALSVDSAGALLGADINPRFWADTRYYVEWGTGKCSEGGCPNQTPAAPGVLLGAGIVNAAIATKGTLINGLTPNATYHYRFVAQSSGGGPLFGTDPDAEGPEEPNFERGGEGAFTTAALPQSQPIDTCPNAEFRTGSSATLADCRAYEMVSPVDKNGTDIATLININSNPAALNQSALAGSALTYTTSQAFGYSKGAPYVSQYLARRGSGGWGSEAISPSQGLSPVEISGRIDLEFRAFTPDLCTGALVHFTDPPLAPESVSGFVNVNTRNNCTALSSYGAVTTTAPPNKLPKVYVPEVQGLSADGRCAVFRASDQLTPDAQPGTQRQLYASCGGGPLRLFSALPSGLAFAGDSTVGTAQFSNESIRGLILASAVSADGSRAYWTAAGGGPGKLFLRINADQDQSAMSGTTCLEEDKACTLKVSETVSSGPASFWAASGDGSRALFTMESAAPIKEGGSGKLYEYDLAARDSTEIAKEVTGVIGASDDATRVYFTSKAALAGPNAEGNSPTVGKANLYLFDANREEADRFRFIAELSAEDAKATAKRALTPLNIEPYKKTSRVAASGEAVAFMSNASLTGYDNVDSKSGKAEAEVFLYRAGANEGQGALVCLSCNPTGQRPAGRDVLVEGEATGENFSAALLPTYATGLYGSRVISADGNRVYFNGYEALVNGDTNGRADVYQWEAPGTGSCSAAAPAYSPPNGGCLSLISSGESPTDSAFVDASADGTDVFFTTDASLLPQDPGLIDIYDARAGGGYPPPPPPAGECEGEACQSPPAPPNDPTPGSLSFNGPGNLKPAKKKAAKKKQKKHNKKNKGKKNKKKAKKQANNNRKAKR